MSDDPFKYIEDGAWIVAGLLVVGFIAVMIGGLGGWAAEGLWGTAAVVPGGPAGLFGLGVAVVVCSVVGAVVVLYVLGAFANEGIPRLEAWYDYLTGGDDNP